MPTITGKEFSMDSGIYAITNTVTKKVYVGQAISIHTRLREHKSRLEKGNHRNPHLQNSYNKYGKDCFILETLLECNPADLTLYEQVFVDIYTRINGVYNHRICVDSNSGIERSDEARINMSNAQKGHKTSLETKLKMSLARRGKNNPNYGHRMSEENKAKISLVHKKIHCHRGHELVDGNLYYYTRPNGTIQRICKTCILENSKNARERKRNWMKLIPV